MKYIIAKPAKALQGIVKHYIIIESLEDSEHFWFLPNGGNYIVFNQGIKATARSLKENGTDFSIPGSFSVSKKSNEIHWVDIDSPDTLSHITQPIIVAALMPTGFYRLFHKEAYHLREGYRPLEHYMATKEIDFTPLYTIDGTEQQLDFIDQQLIQMKKNGKPIKKEFIQILQTIEKSHKNLQVMELLKKFGYSRTTLERDFKKIVGHTPKEYILISKFFKIFHNLKEHGYTFQDIKYDFFDQSHMNKVFKKFINIPPSQLKAHMHQHDIRIFDLYDDGLPN